MARLWQCGFEENFAGNIEFQASNLGQSAGTISSTTKHSGTYGYRANSVSPNGLSNSFQFLSAASNGPYFFRVYLNIASAPSAISSAIAVYNLVGGGPFGRIRVATDRTLELWDSAGKIGSSSAALTLNTWYRLELKYFNNTGSGKLELDGRLDGTSFASTTTSTNVAAIGLVTWGMLSGVTADIYIDDIAINDSTGSFQTSFPGDGNIIHLRPNAAGDANSFATQVGGTAGSANNYTRVNEVTPDDATTYNGSTTVNQEDLFNVDASGLTTSATVSVVMIGGRFADITAADATAAFKFEVEKTSGGTISQSAAIIPNSNLWSSNALVNPFLYPLITYQDPDSAAWTSTTLDSMQIGYKLTTANTRVVAITAVWASVDYSATALAISVSDSVTITESIGVAEKLLILFDAGSQSAEVTANTTLSWTHTVTYGSNSNGLLVVGVGLNDASTTDRVITGITYNGVALTKIRADDNTQLRRSELWYLIAPSSGANTITVTTTATVDAMSGVATSFMEARQVNIPDGQNGANNSAAVTSTSVAITSVANNCWAVDVLQQQQTGTVYVPGGSQTTRAHLDGSLGHVYMSTQGPKNPAGTVTDTWSWTTAGTYATSMITIAPASAIEVAVSDSITLTESIVVSRNLVPNVNDAVTVAETIKMQLVSQQSVSDAITVAETVILAVPLPVNVFDSITVSEFTLFSSGTTISVSDAVTVSEFTKINLSSITISDSVTVSESVSLLVFVPSPPVLVFVPEHYEMQGVVIR